MSRIRALILATSVMLVSPLALMAQAPDKIEALKREIADLKKGQAAIQKDLQDIKRLLSSTRTPTAAPRHQPTVSLKGQPFKGSEEAKLVLVEFSDYQ